MAFESLTERMQSIFKKMRGQAHITESNMDEIMEVLKPYLV